MTPSNTVLLGALAAVFASACASTPIDEVEGAFESPTGEVSPSSLRELVALRRVIEVAGPALGAITVPRPNGTEPEECREGTMYDGVYDLSCATDGEMTGYLRVEREDDGPAGNFTSFEVYTYDDVCVGSTCVSGVQEARSGFSDSESVNNNWAYSIDVTHDGKTDHVLFGRIWDDMNPDCFAIVFTADESSFQIDRCEFVFLAFEDVEAYRVEGANGSYECRLDGDGGDCSGEGSEFTF